MKTQNKNLVLDIKLLRKSIFHRGYESQTKKIVRKKIKELLKLKLFDKKLYEKY